MQQIHVDIFSDIICPWCYIGKKRLEEAFALRPDIKPVYHWRGFLLNPSMPAQGMGRKDYLRAKFGHAANAVYGRIAEAGSEAGIDFAFDEITKTPDSRPIHHLLLAAGPACFALSESFFRAYFLQGKDISEPELQAELCAENGLSIDALTAQTDTSKLQLEADLQQGQAFQVEGVPFMVFDSRFSLAGAHPPDVLTNVIDAVIEQSAD